MAIWRYVMDKRTKAKIEKLCKKYGFELPTAVFRIVGRPLKLVVNDDGDVISPTWRFPSDGGVRTFPVGLYVVEEKNDNGYGPKMVGTTYKGASYEHFNSNEIEVLRSQGCIKLLKFE